MKYNIDTPSSKDSLESITVVAATKRSGHHAFIESLCGERQNFLYLNNVNTNDNIERDRYQLKHIETDIAITDSITENQEFGVVEYNNKALNHLLLSFENKRCESIARSARFIKAREYAEENSIDMNLLLFLRDPINCLASIARYNEVKRNYRVSVKEQANIWVSLAQSFFNFEETSKALGVPVNLLRYNDYIRNRLNFQASKTPDRLSRFGVGGDSKFSTDHNQDLLSVASLESRWRLLDNVKPLQQVFQDNAELRELSRKYYSEGELSDGLKQGISTFLDVE